MKRTALAAAVLASLCFVGSASAASDPTYTALRAIRPDGRTVALNNFVFERDVVRFTLTGTLHLLSPIEGKTSGAVFVGHGSYTLTPVMETERRQLALVTNDEKLTAVSDQFDSAIFLGGALIEAVKKVGEPIAGVADGKAIDRWEQYLKKQRRDLTTNIHVRLLQEVIDGGEPLFLAWVDGKKHPPAALIVDPRGAESVRLFGDMGGEQTAMLVLSNDKGGIWYSSRLKSELEAGKARVIHPLADAEHYEISADIEGSRLNATSTMTFKPSAAYRVLPIELAPKLRISDAQFAPAGDNPSWTPLPFIQEHEKEDGDSAVVFPARLEAGKSYLVKITYGGKDVLENAGDGNFIVRRRENWYPNVGTFTDVATFELRFRTPEKFQIIGVGEEVENRVEGKERIAVWRAKNPIRVAGFNYGKFKKMSQVDKDSGMTFDVYTNPGTPDILRRINEALEYIAQTEGGPGHIRVDTASLAQSTLADGINTARTGNLFFGPLPDKRVSITQQSEWFYGQSWPTLIYIPYIAFLNGTQRNTLGMGLGAKEFIDNVGPHELGHQWWGNLVGWKSYHDEWISEGFAEFTSALVVQQTGGWGKYGQFWEKAQKTILERPRAASINNNDAGPISQGRRLSTWRNPYAYHNIVYSKGAYVLHMLRMAMYDHKTGDQVFSAMMTDFVKTYAGKNASTTDFKRIVEKHAPPNVRLTTDGKMDWFFDQWVYGTDIPKQVAKLDVKDVGGGKYKISGTITQSEVPEGFVSSVPIYVYFDKGSFVKLANTIIIGPQTKPIDVEIALPKKPQKIGINALNDVLTR